MIPKLFVNLLSIKALSWLLLSCISFTFGCDPQSLQYKDPFNGYIFDGPLDYKSNTSCKWLIESPDRKEFPFISLTISLKDTECLYDYLNVYDDITRGRKLLGTFSGNSTGPPVTSSTGLMLINFFSDSDYERSGFLAKFKIFSCPNNCSNNGRCIDHQCYCSALWFGEDCSFAACPNDCTGLDHGECLHSSDKRCKCLNNYMGADCSLSDVGLEAANTWKMVHNYSHDAVQTHLAGHKAVYVQPYLWIFGGHNFSANSNRLLQYSFSSNYWKLIVHDNQPSARSFHTLNHLHHDNQDYLILFGGRLGPQSYSNELWSYSITNNLWKHYRAVSHVLPPAVCEHASAVVTDANGDKYLYAFGGTTEESLKKSFSSHMFRYKWRTKEWEYVTYSPAGVKRSKLRLAGHSMVYDPLSQSLIVFGGFQGMFSSARSNFLYIFSLDKFFWYQVQSSNSPMPRAFHSANLIGGYMVLFGGNTHTHVEDESCHNRELYLYNIRCHEWSQPHTNFKPTGRFSHASGSSDNVVYVHGGYDGTISNQLFAYKLPTYAMKVSPTVVCDTYRSEGTCVKDQRCAWCQGKSVCVTKEDENSKCDGSKLVAPTCEGVCNKVSDCASCAAVTRYTLNSSYEWSPSTCGWCVQDIKCYPSEKPDSSSLCRYGIPRSGKHWWKSSHWVVNQTGCLKDNIPPGFNLLMYRSNHDVSSPDKVKFVRGKLDFKEKNFENFPAQVKVQGFFYPITFSRNSNISLKYNEKEGKGVFSLSTDSSEKNLKRLSPGFTNRSLQSQKERLLYRISFRLVDKKGKFRLSWSYDGNPSRTIDYEYLEPYNSPQVENLCETYMTCLACVADMTCAWCPSHSVCITKNLILEDKSFCSEPDDAMVGVITEPNSCLVCSDHMSCVSCLQSQSCEWNIKMHCVRRNSISGGIIRDRLECPSRCHERDSCDTCLSEFGEERCVWCPVTGSCYGLSQQIPYNKFGECSLSVTDKSGCVNCSLLTSCSDCLDEYGCGWCSNASNLLQGKCLRGDFDGPIESARCPAKEADWPMQWSYARCPDYDECTLEWPPGNTLHKCSNNSSCSNTDGSYTCSCDVGFSGDGFKCTQVCRRNCGHGSCSGSPDFRCICELGWTSDPTRLIDCDVDCLCNFHSTCVTSVGVCDRCHHNTMGQHCDTCKSGYHMVPASGNKTLCQECHCNKHGDPDTGMCDMDTGVCDCLHNTTGDSCQECQDGFYGDPRDGGTCYKKCDARFLFPIWTKTGAFGAWQLTPSSGRPPYCMWVVQAPDDHVIDFVIKKGQIEVSCEEGHIFVYDQMPGDNFSMTSRLAALCGSDVEDSIQLFSYSGYLVVVYEVDSKLESSGFNATFAVAPATSCGNSSADCSPKRQNFACANNCSDRGFCKNAICHCHPGYAGTSCHLATSNIDQASYFQLEWHQTLHQLAGESITEIPPPMFGNSLVAIGADIFVFGGCDKSGPLNRLFRYDTKNKTWKEIMSRVAPSPRYRHAATAVRDTIFVFGGVGGDLAPSSEMWRLEVNSTQKYQDWELVSTSEGPPALQGHTITNLSPYSILVLIGGFNKRLGLNQAVWLFNVSHSEWRESPKPSGALFQGSFGHTAVYDVTTDLIYVHGGLQYNGSEFEATSDTFTYSVKHNRWGSILRAGRELEIMKPPPRYLHVVMEYDDGEHRGFVVTGGLSNYDVIDDDVWLFRYDCHLWTNMSPSKRSNKRGGENPVLLPTSLGYSMSSAVVRDGDKGTLYLFGGGKNGILSNQIQTLHLVSPCYAASTECDCEIIRANCYLCIFQGDSVCAPPRNLTAPQCDLLNNYSSRSEKAIKTQSCAATSNNFKLCPTHGDVTIRPFHCSHITDCQTCLARVPHSSATYCKWCDNRCVTEVDDCSNTTCDNSHCSSQSCPECSSSDCSSCLLQSSSNCSWQRHTLPSRDFWNCSSNSSSSSRSNSPSPLPIHINRDPGSCPSSCNIHTDCHSCLSAPGGGHAGPAGCKWSPDFNKCFYSLEAQVECRDGSCGSLVRTPVSTCPLMDCERVGYCHRCIEHRECGWVGLDDGSGRGSCTRGSHQNPRDNTTLSGSLQWWYMTCPAEDECKNNHHDCREEEPDFDKCVDTDSGYRCDCLTGYHRVSPEKPCQPVCEPECSNGECIKPNICKCQFGYTGKSCDVTCKCNGFSDCPSEEKSYECTKCMNNTDGKNCQYCRKGFVGNPRTEKERPCRSCLEVCNKRSSNCIELTPPGGLRRFGPLSNDETICLDCDGNSEGHLCQDCKDGYFMLEGSCRKCHCNGHGVRCDKRTGANCQCHNHTTTSGTCALPPNQLPVSDGMVGCWSKQCDLCEDGYDGDPTDNGQCFYLVHFHEDICFNPKLRSGCVQSYQPPPELEVGNSLLLALHPKFTNVDIRIIIDVTEGQVDVFVSDVSRTFNISVDHVTGRHIVTPKWNSDQFLREKRSPYMSMKNPRDALRHLRTVAAPKFNNYVKLVPGDALVVTGVRDRLVITSTHDGYDLRDTKFYVIILATESDDVTKTTTTDAPNRVRRESDSNIPARGKLVFRQDQTRIDLFVFFSVFFCCFFLFLSVCIVVWKIKQVVDTQQARIAHQVQMEHMANRPFSCAYVYLDQNNLLAPTSAVQSQRSRFSVDQSDRSSQATPLLSDQSAGDARCVEIVAPRQKILNRCLKPSIIKPASSDVSIPHHPGAFTRSSAPRYNGDVIEKSLRHRGGVSLDALPTNSEPEIVEPGEARRHSDNVGQRRAWEGVGVGGGGGVVMEDGKKKKNLMVHFQPDSMETNIPLLHTTTGYLTVVSGPDGDPRLTPENIEPVTSSKRSSFKKKVFRKSMEARLHQSPHESAEETSFSIVMSRSASTPTLIKPVSTSTQKTPSRVTFGKSSNPRMTSKFGKLGLHRRRNAATVNVGPIAVEPTEDCNAGVATVILQFPSYPNSPCSIGLGSAITTTKSMNLPNSSDFNTSSRNKYKLPRRKRF